MSHAKYIAVSSAIEKDIRAGVYMSRIPSVQALAQKYNVAIQTMHNALKPLVAKGLIKATRHGSFVNSKVKPFSHRVGVFAESNYPEPFQDPQLKNLRKFAEADGDELVYLGPLRDMLAKNPDFYLHENLDGYIFLYSNFNLELSAKLREHKIPALICNNLPEELGFDSLDFNHKQWLDDAVGALVAQGCRRIGTLFSRSLDNLLSWENEVSTAETLKREYQLKPYNLVDQLPDSSDEQIEKLFDLLMAEPVFSDALILTGPIMPKLINKLIKAGKSPGRDYLLVVTLDHPQYLPDSSVFAYIQYNYEKNALAIWKRFRELRNDPEQPPRSILTDTSKCFVKMK